MVLEKTKLNYVFSEKKNGNVYSCQCGSEMEKSFGALVCKECWWVWDWVKGWINANEKMKRPEFKPCCPICKSENLISESRIDPEIGIYHCLRCYLTIKIMP